MFIERRKYPRLSIKLPIEYTIFHNGYEDHTNIGSVESINLCERGLQIGMKPLEEQLLLHGSRLVVKFELPETNYTISTTAQVVMIHKRSSQTGMNHIRLYFPDINVHDCERIRTFIEERIDKKI